MEVEIGSFRIKKGKTVIELTADEAKELYGKLNDHFGMILDFKKTGSDSLFNTVKETMTFEGSGHKNYNTKGGTGG
jgi:hypothetical protein